MVNTQRHITLINNLINTFHCTNNQNGHHNKISIFVTSWEHVIHGMQGKTNSNWFLHETDAMLAHVYVWLCLLS